MNTLYSHRECIDMKDTEQNTHLKTSEKLVGSVVSIRENSATVRLTISGEMEVDHFGLAHGGFVFGLADYAAMVAVNEPTVVLGKADVKFLKPVVVGDTVTAEATVLTKPGEKKTAVSVVVTNQDGVAVFEGAFVCFVLPKHILDQ